MVGARLVGSDGGMCRKVVGDGDTLIRGGENDRTEFPEEGR